MHPKVEMPAGLRQARRSAAVARASLAVTGSVIAIAGAPVTHRHPHHPVLVLIGCAIIFATALVQLIAPRAEWIKIEESLAPVSAILIVGLGPERITTPWLLWLVAVACGVLARGGRVFWVGRAMLLASLALPPVRHGGVTLTYGAVCLAAITLLLVCGRVTQELRAMLDKARHDADHDDLTGALNRAAFRRTLDAFLARGGDGAVLLLDLDNFGAINKSAGHAAGDAALRRVAEHLERVAGEHGIVGRLGGDEFAVILTAPDAEPAARRMLADVVAKPESDPSLEASIGMALFARDGEDAESLLRAVDVAPRVAKRTGISQLSVYAGDPITGAGRAAPTTRWSASSPARASRWRCSRSCRCPTEPCTPTRRAGSLPPGLELDPAALVRPRRRVRRA